MIVLLYTAAMPFTPTEWLFGSIEGAYLIDRLVAGMVLLIALYFQFALAGQTFTVALAIPNPLAEGDTYTPSGRTSSSSAKQEFVFFYRPSEYWTYMAAEFGLLFLAQFGPFEFVRRIIVASIVGLLWAVGWIITPQSTKKWAWGHVKTFWFFIVLDLIRDIGMGQGGGRRRRR